MTDSPTQTIEFADIPESQIPHPTLFRVAVTPSRPRRKTAGGILLPEDAQKNEAIMSQVCKVIALGDKAFKGDLFNGDEWSRENIKVGSIVIIGTYAGQRMEIKNYGKDAAEWPTNRVYFINDHDILTKIPNAEDYKMFNG